MSSSSFNSVNDDAECKRIIAIKDYYELMKVDKSATQDEIRRAYKKFHPDKNKSEHATDAFKKISHIFQILSNEEKRAFYDQYGPEEEVRERVQQQQRQQQQYYYTFDGEMDPNDLFRMFFGDMNIRRPQRRQHHERPQQPVNKYNLLISQLLPFILMFLIYVVPYLLQSTPLYAFERSEEFYIKKFTPHRAEYFASEKFNVKYDFATMSEYDKRELNREIETNYYEYLQNKCAKVMKQKQEIQYKLYYYQNYPRYVDAFQAELNKLDLTVCNKYNMFSQYVR